jgi:hypothetical protein
LKYKNPNLEQKLIDAIVVDFINFHGAQYCGCDLEMYTCDLRDGKRLSDHEIELNVDVITKYLNLSKISYIEAGITESINRNSHMNECGGVAVVDDKEASKLIESFIDGYRCSAKIKTKTFYAVAVYSELGKPEIKAYCRTKEIAKRELKKYTDEWYSKAPKPDDKHILKLEMIVE